MTVVGTHFRPEFINRIDEAVVFHPLGSAQIRAIAGIQVQRVQKRLGERSISLELSPAALDLIVHQQSLLSVEFVSHRVTVVNQRNGSRITEHNRDLDEALDQVLDRLNRQEWDL